VPVLRAQGGHAAGEDEPGSRLAAVVASSTTEWGPSRMTTCLVGKHPRWNVRQPAS
jgi:hypothetical protein